MPYKRKGDKAAQMRRYRKLGKAKQKAKDELTEKFERTMRDLEKRFKEDKKFFEEVRILKKVLEPQLRKLRELEVNSEHVKMALNLFYNVHLIARDPNLNDREARERIINFRFENVPTYFINILNQLGKEKAAKEMVKVE